MMEYLRNYFDSQAVNDYEKADIILSLFFSVLDFIVIMITRILFNSNHKEISDLCYQLVGIFFVDIIIRLYHIYLIQKSNSNAFIKEMISCIFCTSLFYLTLSLFNKVDKMLKIKNKLNIMLYCIFYVLCFFSYDKIITFNPITFSSYNISFGSLILLTQSLLCIIFFYYILDMVSPSINSIVAKIAHGKSISRPLHKFILGAPLSILILFIFHYLIKIFLLFFDSPLILLYGTIATLIFKDGAKYFVLFSCEIILYAMNDLVIQENNKKNDLDEVQIMNS